MDAAREAKAPSAHAEPEGVGAFLRERRIALGLSYADVAHVVKLPPRRIESLENERWSELPDGPFLRGFLRNVARALELDATSLMDRVDDSLMRARNPDSILVAPGSTQATLPRRRGPADDRHGGRPLIVAAFLFAIVAALIAWSGTESFDRTLTAGRAWMQPTVAGSAPRVAPAAVVPVGAGPSVDGPRIAAGASPAPAGTSSPDGQPLVASVAPDATAARDLTFHFNEDSWVEVRAADGRVLLKALNAAGSEQRIEGEAPYSLIVGNAKGVDLRFRGQPVDLGPYTRDQVARLTLS